MLRFEKRIWVAMLLILAVGLGWAFHILYPHVGEPCRKETYETVGTFLDEPVNPMKILNNKPVKYHTAKMMVTACKAPPVHPETPPGFDHAYGMPLFLGGEPR